MSANAVVRARIDEHIKEEVQRDYKREAKGLHRATLESDFMSLVAVLANDQPLVRLGSHSELGL